MEGGCSNLKPLALMGIVTWNYRATSQGPSQIAGIPGGWVVLSISESHLITKRLQRIGPIKVTIVISPIRSPGEIQVEALVLVILGPGGGVAVDLN